MKADKPLPITMAMLLRSLSLFLALLTVGCTPVTIYTGALNPKPEHLASKPLCTRYIELSGQAWTRYYQSLHEELIRRGLNRDDCRLILQDAHPEYLGSQ